MSNIKRAIRAMRRKRKGAQHDMDRYRTVEGERVLVWVGGVEYNGKLDITKTSISTLNNNYHRDFAISAEAYTLDDLYKYNSYESNGAINNEINSYDKKILNEDL
jgi:hypothetical protein